MLEGLLELSREPSTEKRREVLQKLSQLFSEGADIYSEHENVLFGEILVRLLDQVPINDRVVLSERISHIEATPRDLAFRLANDVAEVAAPVLEFSSALTDDDLAHLAGSQGQDHLLAISRRNFLSENMTDIIVERGEDRVLTSVAGNVGAQFSQVGFTVLASKAANTAGLGEILARRADLPEFVAEKIMPMLAEDSRKRLQYLIDNDQGRVQSLLQSTQAEVDGAQKYMRRERIELQLMMADIKDGKRTLSGAVDQLVGEKRATDVACVLAEFASLPVSQVANVIHKPDASGIGAVCKSVDLDSGVYYKLSLFRCEKLKLHEMSAQRYLREYEVLDKATAERAIRFHKVRNSVAR